MHELRQFIDYHLISLRKIYKMSIFWERERERDRERKRERERERERERKRERHREREIENDFGKQI